MTLPKHEDIILKSITQTKEKCDSLVLSRAGFCMVGRCHGILCFHFVFLCLEATVKKHLDENDVRHGHGNYFKSDVLKVTSFKLCSKFFLNNCEAHWQWHLKDTLQLKILRAWTNNIHANSFLSKYHKIKMGEVAMEIINCTKIRACSLKNIAPGHFTYS